MMGGRGAGGLVRGEGGGEGGGGEGVAGGGSSCFTPGRAEGEDDGFLFPECGKKLEREREAATAPHSCIQLAPAVGIANLDWGKVSIKLCINIGITSVQYQ